MKRRLLLAFAALTLSAGLSQAAFAVTLTLSLSNPSQNAIPGGILSYTGTITNTSASTINLDGIEFNYNNSYSSMDPNATTPPSCTGTAPCIDGNPFLNSPLTLDGGASYTGVLFNVDVPSSSALTTFSGFVDITGDAAGSPLTSNTVAFSTTVTPEPSSWLLMATGLAGLAIAYRFRPQTVPAMTRL